ncbi:nucleoside phosphorylase domain-containing protein [Trichoderma sp. SZMC 28011]
MLDTLKMKNLHHPKNSLTYEDYKIGMICALPKELAAVKASFDERHQCLPQLNKDTNSYCLGSIGTQNVVAACLPYEEYGINTAAKRIFLVGIGGGNPSKEHDIRLGDDIVGTGIIQHDMGKAMQKDSRLLRTRLFEAGFSHEEAQNTCQNCRGPEVIRGSRTPRPHVHYGIIACRNSIGTETKAICIEMEATGVMTTGRCLVIRGICDYADSHKNDDRHNYAAASAAAYTRHFILHIAT